MNTLEFQNRLDPNEYFYYTEFDSRFKKDSGLLMDSTLIAKLTIMSKMLGYNPRINSGYRTKYHNKIAGGVGNSAHKSGLAADLRAISSQQKYEIVKAAIMAGVPRIGVGKRFIHVDTDSTKRQNIIWLYE